MRPARIIPIVVFAVAVAAIGSYLALSSTSHPSATPQPAGTAAPPLYPAPTTRPGPDMPPSTTRSSGGQPMTGRCTASAVAGTVQDSDGAAGHIWYRVQLRNTSVRSCTVKGIPGVQLLGSQGQPLTAPSVPGGPAGSLVVLRPGQAARFVFSEPNACDRFVMGSRLLVTLPHGQGSLVVDLGGATRFGTCGSVGVQALQATPTPTKPGVDRISDPQLAADRLVAVWLGGDRLAAGMLTSKAVTQRLFSESPPAKRPVTEPCRLAGPGVFVCSYRIADHFELTILVRGGASAGYGVSGVEFGD
jgi:hypothetical protein